MGYTIRTDYHAIRDSGFRPLSSIEWLVLHDIESTNETGAAEGAGAWFENRAVQASAHYGIDNNSIQCYLALSRIAWGAPGANQNGVHIEQMGVARWTRDQWMDHARPTLDRCAWLLWRLHRRLPHVPLRVLTDADVRAHHHGIVTHRQLTRVLGVGTHTDPGTGYPIGWVVERAHHYAAGGD